MATQRVNWTRSKIWIIVALALIAVVIGFIQIRNQRLGPLGARLVGAWDPFDQYVPSSMYFAADGTGHMGSGAGHFRFRWKVINEDESQNTLVVRVTYTGHWHGSDPKNVSVVEPFAPIGYTVVFQGLDLAQISSESLQRPEVWGRSPPYRDAWRQKPPPSTP
jgi:hypothetical protein